MCPLNFAINIFFSQFAAYSLKDLKIFVPDAVISGSAATLSCQYDLGKVKRSLYLIFTQLLYVFIFIFYVQASLYSVRWYFEGEEFYRYVPKESPPMRVFPVSGILVDVSYFVPKKKQKTSSDFLYNFLFFFVYPFSYHYRMQPQ